MTDKKFSVAEVTIAVGEASTEKQEKSEQGATFVFEKGKECDGSVLNFRSDSLDKIGESKVDLSNLNKDSLVEEV